MERQSTFSFADASSERVWLAAVQAVSKLGYSVLHSDRASKMLSFNTGRSMSSWAGQDLTELWCPRAQGQP